MKNNYITDQLTFLRDGELVFWRRRTTLDTSLFSLVKTYAFDMCICIERVSHVVVFAFTYFEIKANQHEEKQYLF